MTRNSHKPDRMLSKEDTFALLARGRFATISVNGDDGYPYAVPTNYVLVDGAIYMHSAKYGYRIEMLEKNPKVCLSAIISAEVAPAKVTAYYESVVVTGKASFVEDEAEKRKALEAFVADFPAEYIPVGLKFAKGAFDKTLVTKIDIEDITGKAYIR